MFKKSSKFFEVKYFCPIHQWWERGIMEVKHGKCLTELFLEGTKVRFYSVSRRGKKVPVIETIKFSLKEIEAVLYIIAGGMICDMYNHSPLIEVFPHSHDLFDMQRKVLQMGISQRPITKIKS